MQPSMQPKLEPSSRPSSQPSDQPLTTPSLLLTHHPSMVLSAIPSFSEGPTEIPTEIPTFIPTIGPLFSPTISTDKTYVGFLSYRDPYSCSKLNSFIIYPTSACLVMAHSHPDGSAFINGHVKYSCGLNNASALSYFPTDNSCSQEPYDIYPLPNYDSCPVEENSHLYSCLHASSVSALAKSVKGVVNK